jgi:hypothetical protein
MTEFASDLLLRITWLLTKLLGNTPKREQRTIPNRRLPFRIVVPEIYMRKVGL